MRLADRLLRQGHLSEDALTTAVVTGERPAHLDICSTCSTRALEVGRWLESLRIEAVSEADAAFSPERLALQHTQILRRIAQVEEPVRVLEFPTTQAASRSGGTIRRVSAGWLGVAAAAGLAVGVVSGHFSAYLRQAGQVPVSSTEAGAPTAEPDVPDTPGSLPLLELELERSIPATLQDMDENTPRLLPAAQYVALR